MTANATFMLWFSLACIVYTYAGYPLVLTLISAAHQLRSDWRQVSGGASRSGTRRVATQTDLPHVAVLVAAFNEEQHIAERITNLLNQDYPADRLHIYIGSDASSDRTGDIVRSMAHPRLTFVDFTARRGKASVINDLAAMASQEILAFTDANTMFLPDAVQKLVRHFGRPEVACVCGELRLVKADADPLKANDNQDHIYWRYERLLKFFESRIGGLLGANGGVYALRRELYRAIPSDTIVDDFWISMQVVEDGQRCVYDPEAVALETIPERISDEFRRRVRIGLGNYQAFRRFATLLSPLRGTVAFTFFSHKVLRWLVPHCMLMAFVCNLLLITQGFYAALMLGQLLFYGGAWYAWRCSLTGAAPKALRLPLFFVSMNLGLWMGFWRYMVGGTSGVWARSAR
jgi:cellulose synthase/poly-beta-1,6-N-acetylglucosamine synthase-like glycosyltransferase